MDIYSPDDCYAVKIFVKIGNVNQGDSLIQLFSPDIELKVDRIGKYQSLLTIQKRQYLAPRITVSKTSETDHLNLEKEQANSQTNLYSEKKEQYVLNGNVSDKDLSLIAAAISREQVNLNNQQLVVDQFDTKNQDSVDQIDMFFAMATADLAILNDLQNKLLIKAPAVGVFNSFSLEGMFYKKGQLIGTFIPAKSRY